MADHSHDQYPTEPAGEPVRPGELSVLHTGKGDTTYRFNPDSPQETETARTVLEALLKQHFVILIKTADGRTQRVSGFDPKTDEYIIQARAPEKKERVKAEQAEATAVAPTSGG